MSRHEIKQLIDDAGKVLEETARAPLVQRDFKNMIYKTNENALVDEPETLFTMDNVENSESAAAEAEFKEAVVEVVQAFRDKIEQLENEIAALRTDMHVVTSAQRHETKRLCGKVKNR
jgi:type VI protein secretion system component VasF